MAITSTPGKADSFSEGGRNPSPTTAANTCPVSPGIPGAPGPESPEISGIEQPGGPGASFWNLSQDSQLHDTRQTHLAVSGLPEAFVLVT